MSTLAEQLSAPTLLNFRSLFRYAERHAQTYAAAKPFPHIMIEDFLSEEVVEQLLAEFPEPGSDLQWRELLSEDDDGEVVQFNKQGMPRLEVLGPTTRELIWEMNSGSFLRFLERLTGISNLLADPMLQGGGLHQVLPGGVLGVHADFTRHRVYKIARRLNVLVYLNRDWPLEYEGNLELWNTSMTACERRIRPLAGRCVIFSTTDTSYHGHPVPLACPEGVTRKSIAHYYYTRGRGDDGVAPTTQTAWQPLPETELPPAE